MRSAPPIVSRLAVPTLLILALTAESFRALHGLWVDWANTTQVHGYLVATISAWLLFRAARRVPGSQWTADLRGAPLLLAAALLWLFAAVSGLQFLEFLLLPPLFGLAVWVSAGPVVARRTAFAVAYLWFATPLWQAINPLLQWATVHAARLLLTLIGIPVHFHDNAVQIPAGTFEIAGGCSGLHFFVVALALGALLGELRGDRPGRRLRVLLLAGALGAAINWIRVTSLVLIGHLTHMQHPVVATSHYWYGWVLFAVALLVFFLLERRIPDDYSRPSAVPEVAGPGIASLRGVLTVAAIVAGALLWKSLALRPYEGSWASGPVPADWAAKEAGVTGWRPVFAGTDAAQLDAWQDLRGRQVGRYSGLYRVQFQGKEFSGYGNDPAGSAPEKGWRYRATYTVGGRTFDSPVLAQAWYAMRALASLRAPASIVQVLRSPCEPDCEAAEANLKAWTQ